MRGLAFALTLPLAFAVSSMARAESSPPKRKTDCRVGARVVKLATEDGISLEAELHVPKAGSPVVVLFHMIPPSNDRKNYPPAFMEALLTRGWAVLNVDRRGAGRSGGVAREAYRGPKGALDVAAAVDFLGDHPCKFDLGRLTLVGASNGTTSILDYAQTHGARPPPSGLVFLTGGKYTEAQFSLQTERKSTPRVLFAWGQREAPARKWAEAHKEGAPSGWAFQSYPSGAHGTRLLERLPAAIKGVVAWIHSR
ncbi:MAG: alpha/beta hydrolase [Myxococcota bacterium]